MVPLLFQLIRKQTNKVKKQNQTLASSRLDSDRPHFHIQVASQPSDSPLEVDTGLATFHLYSSHPCSGCHFLFMLCYSGFLVVFLYLGLPLTSLHPKSSLSRAASVTSVMKDKTRVTVAHKALPACYLNGIMLHLPCCLFCWSHTACLVCSSDMSYILPPSTQCYFSP